MLQKMQNRNQGGVVENGDFGRSSFYYASADCLSRMPIMGDKARR